MELIDLFLENLFLCSSLEEEEAVFAQAQEAMTQEQFSKFTILASPF